MFRSLKRALRRDIHSAYVPPKTDIGGEPNLSDNLTRNLFEIRRRFSNTSDLIIRELDHGPVKIALLMCEGMFNLADLNKLVLVPMSQNKAGTAKEFLDWVRSDVFFSGNQIEIRTYDEAMTLMMSGFVVLMIDGECPATAIGLQGYKSRSVSEPSSEVNVRGSKEGFVEPLRVNMSLVRRRMRTPALKMELMTIEGGAKTDVCLVYRVDRVNPKELDRVRGRLACAKLDNIQASGYLQPFLDTHHLSLFTGVGVTERPDTLCAKVAEGRVGVLVDNSPFALIVPYLFVENFQSLDDYCSRPYYATFIRLIKYLAFFVTILLPGVYVALVNFHLELLPIELLHKIVVSERLTPFPLMFEAIIIHLIYEMVREAGLRMPKEVGHAVGIVGALVVGDAAVKAGIIGAPMVIVVALTAISAFVVPSLYEPVTVLRFAFIIVGGTLGLFGIMLGFAVVLLNLCAIKSGDVPVTAPLSPFSLYAMRDVVVRLGWRTLGAEELQVGELKGGENGSLKEGKSN